MTNDRSTARPPLRTIATVVGAFFLVAAVLMILLAIQTNKRSRNAEQTTVARTTAPPTLTPAQKPTPAITARPVVSPAVVAASAPPHVVPAGPVQPRTTARPARIVAPSATPAAAQARAKVAAADRVRAGARARTEYDGGLAALAKNDPKAAVTRFDAALRYLPDGNPTPSDLANAYYGRARAFAAQQQYDRALADYDRALRLEPNARDIERARQDAEHVRAAEHPQRVAAAQRSAAPSASPAPARAASAQAGPASADEACRRALSFERAATNDAAGRLAVYNATVAGLAANASCDDQASHVVNEAYLLSLRAPAEAQLHIGNWNADLQHADERLRACIALPALRGTGVADDCRTQLSINAGVRQELSALAAPAAR